MADEMWIRVLLVELSGRTGNQHLLWRWPSFCVCFHRFLVSSTDSGASTLDDHIRTPSHLKSSSDGYHFHMLVSSFEAFKLLKVNPGIFARHILSCDALACIQAKYPGHDHQDTTHDDD
ncbi:hypothetical protein DKX38_006528 [Salix brachista]|uniref:Uncharacterized protein n=1 Tax=Salix brachista TaxID=2182728 RepID=A0A5N5N540_9ROSI|nr:hypothetical protein DKX38_006528 [Salix brachista]